MTALGLTAGALTTLSFLPQVIRSYRTRTASSFSWAWLVFFACGITAWICYGVLRGDIAILWTNAGTLCLVLLLMLMRARERADARR